MHISYRGAFVPLACATLLSCSAAPSDPSPATSCATPLSLRIGEVREFVGGANVSCLVVASADVPTEYLFTAANASTVQDELREYLVRATLQPTSVTASRALGDDAAALVFRTASANAFDDSASHNEFGAALEGAVRESEKKLLGHRSLSALVAPATGASQFRSLPSHRTVAPAVGDSMPFRVANAANADLCAGYNTVRAVVKAVGQRATVVVDVTAPPNGFVDADFRSLAQEFDAITFPTVADWFGTPSDINGDGRITILITPEINRLTPTGSLGFAGGFFLMQDLLPREVPSQSYRCAASNEQEILYLLAPDPNGQVNGNRFSVETARESARGTMAHEMQHMISQGVRQARGVNALEVLWLNEGLSHFAEEAVGRAARHYGDMQRLDWSNVLTDLDDFDSFFRQNLLRLRLWMARPDLSSPISSRVATELAPRGAAWALVRFAIDQYGGTNPRAFTRALVAGPQVDVANLSARTGVPFDKLLPGFLVASYGDVASASVGAAFRYTSWNLRDVMGSLNGGVYPLRFSDFPTDATTRSLSGSGNYFLVSRSARANLATFRMLGLDGSSVAFPGARVYVTRLR